MLNENQRRRLGVRFNRLVSEAAELEELLVRSTLRSASTSELKAELAELVEAVRQTSAKFSIPIDSRRLPAERQVEFWAAMWQTRVLDCRPARLTGSGPVSPELVESLGPDVERIAAQLDRIRSSAARHGGGGTSEPDG